MWTPLLFPIKFDEVVQKLTDSQFAGGNETIDFLLILHLSLTLFRLCLGVVGFPFLLALTSFGDVVVDDIEFVSAFFDRRHDYTPLLSNLAI